MVAAEKLKDIEGIRAGSWSLEGYRGIGHAST